MFFDEIDGLAVKRSEGDEAAGMHNRVLSTLLSEMDGLQASPPASLATLNKLSTLNLDPFWPFRMR